MTETAQNNPLGAHANDPARDRALAAARRIFFDEGFAGATTDTIVRAAGISKSTLYSRFGGMAGLLRAVAEAEAEASPLDDPPEVETPDAFADALVRMGADLIELVERPEKVQFDRLVLEQARAHPDLASAYWEAIYAAAQTTLARFLARGRDVGASLPDLPDAVLADQLLSLWLGLTATRLRLGLGSGDDGRGPEARSADAVGLLLR